MIQVKLRRKLAPLIAVITGGVILTGLALLIPNLSTYAQTTPTSQSSDAEAAEHAATDLVGTPISVIEKETAANKAKLTQQQGFVPGAARTNKIGSAQATVAPFAVSTDPGVSGRWSSVINTQVVPVFQAVLPDGKVLMWDSVGDNATETYPNQTFTRAMVWNPADNTFVRVDVQGVNIFCSGFAHLANGNILVAGGNKDASLNGLVQTHIFNWQTKTWSQGPNMAAGRWYPSVAEMANGEAVIVGGGAATPEVYQTNGTIRALTNLTDTVYGGRVYPWLLSRPDTLLAMMGPYTANHTADVAGIGAVTSTTTRDSIFRDYGTFAPYDVGRVLVTGGGNITEGGQANVPTKTALVLNENTGLSQPASPTGSMSVGRRQVNATVLADGSVLATGGETSAATSTLVDLNHAVTSAERWDPATGQWQVLSSASRIRQYHSTAALLPDGRVLTGGGGICGTCTTVGYLEKNIEYFSPPYLYKKDGSGTLANRPVIGSTPAVIPANLAFTMTVQGSNSSFKKIALVGFSDVTHDVNQGQRYIPLNYTITSVTNGTLTNVTIKGPTTGNVMTPGYYMLFVVDNNGVPSIAKTVQVTAAPKPVLSPLQNALSGKCMDVPQASTVKGTYLWAYTCNTSAAQALSRTDYDHSIRVLGNCLDVPTQNFVSGQRIWDYTCNGTLAQQWQFNSDGTIRPIAAPTLCLAVTSIDIKTSLLLATCNGSGLQKWNVQVVPAPKPNMSAVKNVLTGQCIDVPQASTAKGTYLWNYACNGTVAQALTRIDYDHSIRVLGNCLDVPNQNFASGQRIWDYTCNGSVAQRWQFNSDGTIRPIAAPTLCLAPASTISLASLILQGCNASAIQKWAW